MKPLVVAVAWLLAGLLGGLALSAMWSDDSGEFGTAQMPSDAALERRLAALEGRIAAVTADNARMAAALEHLEQTLPENAADLTTFDAAEPSTAAQLERGGEVTDDGAEAEFTPPRIAAARRARGVERNLADRLTAAGFSASDAQLIETRIEELRVEAMQSRYEALRSGESPDVLRNQLTDGSATLRSELGDEQYERFLEATGRPTRVGVNSVLARSAAETAGLQSGDEIVAYDGARVYDVRDLNRVLLEGEPGEPVMVDVVRNGQPMQIVMPRGPLGISSGFARGGPR